MREFSRFYDKQEPAVSRLPLAVNVMLNLSNIKVTTCPPNSAPQVLINSCIHLKVRITPIFTLTLLLGKNSKGIDLKDSSCCMSKLGARLIGHF